MSDYDWFEKMEFEPKDDITPHELAMILAMYLKDKKIAIYRRAEWILGEETMRLFRSIK